MAIIISRALDNMYTAIKDLDKLAYYNVELAPIWHADGAFFQVVPLQVNSKLVRSRHDKGRD